MPVMPRTNKSQKIFDDIVGKKKTKENKASKISKESVDKARLTFEETQRVK
jgi:polyhydroxyalkanoate synthesis regulator phasin